MVAYKNLKWNVSVILYNLLKKEAWKEKVEVAEYLALSEKIQAPEFQQATTILILCLIFLSKTISSSRV